MAVVDIHAHIYPSKIADKATRSVANHYELNMWGSGVSENLLASKNASPITHFVVHSVAVKAETVISINDFIASQVKAHPEFIGFATMHHDFLDVESEVERVVQAGLKGFKLHPDCQRVNMDDPRLMRLYEIIEGRLPLIVHTGDYRFDYSHPRRLQNVLRTFPNLVVNAAHLGGWSVFDIAYDHLANENCFLDASSSMAFLGNRRKKELINAYGTDRILFGSDYPMWNPAEEYERFMSLGFTDSEYEKMLWRNAEHFLNQEIH
jgi:predicted TIM-barrel fold metal-dependent hydrolase